MTILDTDLLDISLPVKNILIDKFARINGIVLNPGDFDIVNVQPNAVAGTKSNTKANIAPRASSVYYGSPEFFYKRLVLDDILDVPQVSIMRDAETHVFQLLPKINAAYGINLTVDDVLDDVLPANDPLDPQAPFMVMIAANPLSLLVMGGFAMNINVLAADLSLDGIGDYQSFYAVVTTGNASREHNVVVQTTQGTEITGFNFLSNATSISKVRIDKLMDADASTGEIIVFGEFTLKHPATVLPTAQTYRMLRLNSRGAVLAGYRTPDPITSASQVTTSPDLDHIYYVTGVTIKTVDKATMALSTTNLPVVTTNTAIAGIQSTNEGYLYVLVDQVPAIVPDPMNPLLTTTAYYGRIDRYLSSGVLDAAWAAPILPVAGLTNTGFAGFAATDKDFGVVQDSVYALFHAPLQWSTKQIQVGTPSMVDRTMRTPVCAYNPVLRFSKLGVVEHSFVQEMAGYGQGLLEADELGQPFEPGINYLTAVGEGCALLIKRRNNASAQYGWQPTVFDKTGRMLNDALADQSDDRLMVDALGIASLSHNSILVWGTAQASFEEATTDTYTGVFLYSPAGEYQSMVMNIPGQTVVNVVARTLR